MNVESPLHAQVDDFIREEIDTIPHLEALLLAWNSRPKDWTVEAMARELYVDAAAARNILQDLTRRGFLVVEREVPESYRFRSTSIQRDDIIAAVDAVYRRELVRISRMIHTKMAPAVREFAEAFRFKKDRD